MKSENIIAVFNQLVPVATSSPEAMTIAAHQLEGSPLYIGKTASGLPILLVRVSDDGPITPFELTRIRTRPRCLVVIQDSDGVLEEHELSTIECLDTRPEIHSLFIDLIVRALPTDTTEMSSAELDALIKHLKELFEASSQPSQEALLGLWSELFVGLKSRNPKGMFQAWHPQLNSRIDFANDSEYIEVKSTTQTARRHSFSMGQLNPPEGVFASVASLQTNRIDSGLTIQTLWKRAIGHAHDDHHLRRKIDRLCISILGQCANEVAEISFDESAANSTMRIFPVIEIPKIKSSSLPWGVDQVRFESDLSQAKPLDSASTLCRLTHDLLGGLEC